MLEASMHDLTRDLAGFLRQAEPLVPEVEIELIVDDPDDEALAADWFLHGGGLSDGRIEHAYELAPSTSVALGLATTDAIIS